ncbi:hypothetical protein L1987_43704 [Smallanthus sonchifolius]|uniref:Uncharacterized protein n=1 Tax=Smallanthus sonchifolius TaxID=185202 RepID=A0ACB9GPE8_9ASTR|nr:hypothetical protein L1987_43704 [Smallanthus sonchifolius]
MYATGIFAVLLLRFRESLKVEIVISLGEGATQENGKIIARLFGAVGKIWKPDDKLFDAVTGLSGSGPAYIFLVIQALADGVVAAAVGKGRLAGGGGIGRGRGGIKLIDLDPEPPCEIVPNPAVGGVEPVVNGVADKDIAMEGGSAD